jgi:hypothetical protein
MVRVPFSKRCKVATMLNRSLMLGGNPSLLHFIIAINIPSTPLNDVHFGWSGKKVIFKSYRTIYIMAKKKNIKNVFEGLDEVLKDIKNKPMPKEYWEAGKRILEENREREDKLYRGLSSTKRVNDEFTI